MIDHLSHSQVQGFVMCPRKWHYEKVEQRPKERTPATLAFGCAVHDALAAVNEAAIACESIDASAAFDRTWKATVAQSQAPIHYGKDEADLLLAKGKALVATYVPPSGIIGVEQPFTVELDPALPPITGRIDLIRLNSVGDLILTDLKTSASKLLSDTAAVEAQLSLYNLAYPSSGHEVIVLGKTKTPTITFQAIVPWPVAELRQHYRDVHLAMVSGIKYRVRGWQCPSCPYADHCQADRQ
ncbi:hypothetical protein LBMAG53_22130 [Planctomycetota bacterium]|nr:hypothetical protein LBMAG53_22130 [Planctomycetota bacterium]